MKTNRLIALAALSLSVLSLQVPTALAQGTAFTYQGRLTDNGEPASGPYDFQFSLFAVNSGGSPMTNALFVDDVVMSEGIFTVVLDFGASVFNGADRWLQINVRRGNSTGAFQELSPRQALTPVPYAIRAGTIDRGVVTNPTFVGTTTESPLELFVNNERVLRLEPTTKGPNVIAGFFGNSVSPGVNSATIAGGGSTGNPNQVSAAFGTVGGGLANSVGGTHGVIAGGQENTANSDYSFIGSGQKNTIEPLDLFETNGLFAVIAGGAQNTNRGKAATIGGGQVNTAHGAFSVVAGGLRNSAGGDYSFAAGRRAKANHDGAFVWADSTDADFASSGTNQFLVRSSGGMGIGTANPINRLTVAGAGGFSSISAAAITLNNTALNGHDWEWHALDDGRMQIADRGLGVSRMVIQTNGNVGIGMTFPTDKLHVNGTARVEGSALVEGNVTIGAFPIVTQSALAPAANGTLAPTTGYVVLTPAANLTLNTTNAIANGSITGQILLLQGNGSFTVVVPDNANTRMSGAIVLGNNDLLTLIWNGADWVEQSFSDN